MGEGGGVPETVESSVTRKGKDWWVTYIADLARRTVNEGGSDRKLI